VCKIEGHVANHCPLLRVGEVAPNLTSLPPTRFLGNVVSEYCEICRMNGYPPLLCAMLLKYTSALSMVVCDFCRVNTYTIENCHALQGLAEQFGRSSFQVKEVNPNIVEGGGRGGNGGGYKRGYIGGYLGGRNGGYSGPIRCYNCNEIGHSLEIVLSQGV
jgi:hypothetical protein